MKIIVLILKGQVSFLLSILFSEKSCFSCFFTQNDENFSKYLLKYEEQNTRFSRFLTIFFKKENIFRRKPLYSLSISGDTKDNEPLPKILEKVDFSG